MKSFLLFVLYFTVLGAALGACSHSPKSFAPEPLQWEGDPEKSLKLDDQFLKKSRRIGARQASAEGGAGAVLNP